MPRAPFHVHPDSPAGYLQKYEKDLVDFLRDPDRCPSHGVKVTREGSTVHLDRGNATVTIHVSTEDGLTIWLSEYRDRGFKQETAIPSTYSMTDLYELAVSALSG